MMPVLRHHRSRRSSRWHAVLGLATVGLAAFALPAMAAYDTVPQRPPAEAATSQPTALRFEPATLDLGEMIAGEPKTATLTVVNASDAPVSIASMKGGCGCTTLSAFPKEPIAPGGSFSVEVTVDPGMRTGIDLRKPVHVRLADGRVETMHVVGRVKTVIAITPEQVEAVGSLAGSTASVALASVDGGAFRVTGSAPAGIASLADARASSNRHDLAVDLEAWERAGRPASITLTTDRADAPRLAIPIKFADAVAMFRMPAAEIGSVGIESAQDAILRELDARLPTAARSKQFRMRLHRESGMLFVHGTAEDLEAVRQAVRGLPPSSGVRESVPAPKG